MQGTLIILHCRALLWPLQEIRWPEQTSCNNSTISSSINIVDFALWQLNIAMVATWKEYTSVHCQAHTYVPSYSSPFLYAQIYIAQIHITQIHSNCSGLASSIYVAWPLRLVALLPYPHTPYLSCPTRADTWISSASTLTLTMKLFFFSGPGCDLARKPEKLVRNILPWLPRFLIFDFWMKINPIGKQ